MTQPSTTPTEPEKKFTQADLDRVVADRLNRERAKYADYDELKEAVKAAEGNKSQLDKIESALAQANARAEKAEAATLRAEVAQELGLTARQARKLSGANREEMLADGREMVEDFGIKPKSSDGAKTGTEGGEGAANGDGKGDGGKNEGDGNAAPQQQAPRTGGGRPRENLRSGAPMSTPAAEETDPLKLAAGVARRF
jgi:hypothetical protein